MAEPILHMPSGVHPLQMRRYRPQNPKQPMELTLPEACLWVGRDLLTSGATLVVTEPTGGVHPRYRTLWASRWLEPILTTEKAVELVRDSAAAALAELFASGFFE
jgi:hypothetical protein